MNPILQFTLTTLFKLLSILSHSLSAKTAFYLFQKTYPKKLSENEKEFYENTSFFLLENQIETTKVFEMGDPQRSSIILVHGWNSNAGSMSGIANELVKLNHHVILFDLPAHGTSSRKRTNIKECKIVFQSIYNRFKANQPLSVISHSFGSAVSAHALGELKESVHQLVFLTSPNKLDELFEELRQLLKLNRKTYEQVLTLAENYLEEPLEDISVIKKTQRINYNHLTLIHDRYDKILPISYSELLQKGLDKSTLIPFERIGHYRMLWNQEVLNTIAKIEFSSPNVVKEKEAVA